jgi:hypothetical protein
LGHHTPPAATMTLAGAALAVRIMLVLDVFAGAHINSAASLGPGRRNLRGLLLHDVGEGRADTGLSAITLAAGACSSAPSRSARRLCPASCRCASPPPTPWSPA